MSAVEGVEAIAAAGLRVEGVIAGGAGASTSRGAIAHNGLVNRQGLDQPTAAVALVKPMLRVLESKGSHR